MIADYNNNANAYGNKALWNIVIKRLILKGFMLFDHLDIIPEAQSELDDWVSRGDLKAYDNLYQGVEKIPNAFIDLLTGRTMGKTLVKAL